MTQTESNRTTADHSAGEQSEIELSQGTIQYSDTGTGEPILFVHGAFVNGSLWRNVAGPLSEEFRCIVPTLPLGGHEIPMQPDADLTPLGLAELLAEFVDELGLDRVTLVGNDTGGALCQVFLAEYPDRVERLILTNCDVFDNFPPAEAAPFVWGARIPGFTTLLARSLGVAPVRRLVFKLLAKHPVQPEVLAGYVDGLQNSGVRRDLRKALLGVSPQYTQAAATAFPDFDRPVLLAWAPEDTIFPLEDAEQLAVRFPNAQLERIEDSRGLVPEDNPERLVELTANFLGARLPA